MIKHDITGIVLSGGRSSRMGQNKALMVIQGRPLILHVIDILLPVCDKVVISSNSPVYDFTGCEVWPDDLPVQAALIGLYSCIKRSLTEWNVVLPCDMPLIKTGLFCFLLEHRPGYEAVIPVHNGHIEPLCGLYKRSILPHLEKSISFRQYGMKDFIATTNCRMVNVDSGQIFYHERMFLNINSPGDFDIFSGE